MAYLETRPGDIFYIPAYGPSSAQGLVLARHINEHAGLRVIEVFSKFYLTPPSIDEVDISTRLFRPIFASLEYSKYTIKKKWHVLFHDGSYTPAQSNFYLITIVSPDGRFFLKSKRYLSAADPTKTEELTTIWMPINLSIRASAHLQGVFGPDDAFDWWKLAGLKDTPDHRAELDAFASETVHQARKVCESIQEEIAQLQKARGK